MLRSVSPSLGRHQDDRAHQNTESYYGVSLPRNDLGGSHAHAEQYAQRRENMFSAAMSPQVGGGAESAPTNGNMQSSGQEDDFRQALMDERRLRQEEHQQYQSRMAEERQIAREREEILQRKIVELSEKATNAGRVAKEVIDTHEPYHMDRVVAAHGGHPQQQQQWSSWSPANPQGLVQGPDHPLHPLTASERSRLPAPGYELDQWRSQEGMSQPPRQIEQFGAGYRAEGRMQAPTDQQSLSRGPSPHPHRGMDSTRGIASWQVPSVSPQQSPHTTPQATPQRQTTTPGRAQSPGGLREELLGPGRSLTPTKKRAPPTPSTPQQRTPINSAPSTPLQQVQRQTPMSTPNQQQRPTEPDAATRNTNAELERGLMHAAEQLEMVGLTDEANEVTGLWQAMTSGHLTADQIQKRARQLSALLVQSPAATEQVHPTASPMHLGNSAHPSPYRVEHVREQPDRYSDSHYSDGHYNDGRMPITPEMSRFGGMHHDPRMMHGPMGMRSPAMWM